MVMNRWAFSFCLFVIAAGILMGQNSGENSIRIAWESAGTQFKVEIRRDGQIFQDVITDENEIKMNLPPGVYEYRINTLSPFGKIISTTGWKSLNVERLKPPYFRVKNVLKIKETETNIELPIEGFISNQQVSFFLINDSVRLKVTGTRSGDDFLIQTGLLTIPAGIWDLEAVDSFGAAYRQTGVLEVLESEMFRIERISPETIPGKGKIAVTIKGEGFDKDMKVVFNGLEGVLPVIDFVVKNQESATVYFEMENAEIGEYEMVVTNSDGSRILKEIFLTVVPSSDLPRYAPRIEFHLGYMPLAAFPQNKLFPLLFSPEIAILIQPSWFIPFLKDIGLEAHGFFGSTVFDFLGIINYLGGYDASLYWRPRIKLNFSPVLLLGFGNIHTNSDSFNDENLMYFRIGAAVDFEKFRRITRVGVNFFIAIGGSQSYPMISLTFRSGYRM